MKSRLVAGALLASSLLLGHGTRAGGGHRPVRPARRRERRHAERADHARQHGQLDRTSTAGYHQRDRGARRRRSTTCRSMPTAPPSSGVGLMLFTETGNPNSNVDGGYVRAAIRDMTARQQDHVHRTCSTASTSTGDKSNGGKAGKTMAEAYRISRASRPTPATARTRRTTPATPPATRGSRRRSMHCPATRSTPSTARPTTARSLTGNCGRNYIIYISNGAVQDNNVRQHDRDDARWPTAATAEGIAGATTTIPISPSGSQTNVADEWARFMRRSSLGVVTLHGRRRQGHDRPGPGLDRAAQSMAGVSNGKYFDVTSGSGGAEIADALGRIFSEIQAVNSVFASVSLPVSVNTQGTYLNQVYIGMFRPDAGRAAALGRQPEAVQARHREQPAADARRRRRQARSILTGLHHRMRAQLLDADDGRHLLGVPAAGRLPSRSPNSDVSNYPDGNIVEKGAQAYRLRSDDHAHGEDLQPDVRVLHDADRFQHRERRDHARRCWVPPRTPSAIR